MTASPSEQLLNGAPSPRERSPFGIGFRQPEEPALPLSPTIPLPASSPETSSSAAAVDEPDSVTDEWPDELLNPSPDDTSSPASSSEKKVPNPLVGNALRDTFRSGVIIASAQAHNYLARTQAQREAQLYLANDQDAASIGDPLSRIAARREGLGKVNPDTADLMAAMMGLAGYASRQIQLTASIRAYEQRAAAEPEQFPA